MRRNNMSKYLFQDAVLGFLESYDSKEEEISDLDSIFTDGGEEDVEEISLSDSSSEKEMNKQPCSSASASYVVSKTETRQTTSFTNNLVEQLHIMSLDKVQDRQGLQNLSTQK